MPNRFCSECGLQYYFPIGGDRGCPDCVTESHSSKTSPKPKIIKKSLPKHYKQENPSKPNSKGYRLIKPKPRRRKREEEEWEGDEPEIDAEELEGFDLKASMLTPGVKNINFMNLADMVRQDYNGPPINQVEIQRRPKTNETAKTLLEKQKTKTLIDDSDIPKK